MSVGPPRTRLEQKLRAARLSQRDVLRRFPEQAARLGEGEIFVSERQLKRWLAGGAPTPRAVACRVLEAWFGEPVERLLGPPDEIATLDGAGGDVVAEAGRRSVEHAIDAASALDPSALEHLHAAAQRAARTYLITPPLEMLTGLVQLRDTVYDQLDRTHKPHQQAELYLLAGQVCGLLSSVSFDLGHPGVAEEQARAAHTYGSVIDHPSLCAWAHALLSNMYLWAGRSKQTILVASKALETAPAGTARARLYSVRARALGLLGARAEVATDLGLAAGELDRAGFDALMDGIGGEMGFGRARQALCAGAAYVALGNGERAEVEAKTALALFTEQPTAERWQAGELACRADLAAARVIRADVIGAADALGPVLALPSAQRTEALVLRLASLGRVLGNTKFRGSSEAGEIRGSIAEFVVPDAARLVRSPTALPSGP